MRPGMYGAYHHITVPAREQAGADAARTPAHVVGTLCENNDWFARDRELPPAAVGDLFVIHDTGAHAHSMGFQYNGKLRAPELLLRSCGAAAGGGDEAAAAGGGDEAAADAPRVDVIRERETIHCLYDNVRMPADLDAAAGAAAPFPYAGRPPPPPGACATPAVRGAV